MSGIAIAIIVKNESEVIGRCLASALQITNQIIVIDTGSTDNTVEIVQSYGVAVGYFSWIGDFSAARNHAFDAARACFKPSFLMWLDADDTISLSDASKIKSLIDGGDFDAVLAPYVYATDQYDNPLLTVYRERIVKSDIPYKWEGLVHEAIPIIGKNIKIIESDFVITHRRPVARTPSDRNIKIYQKFIEDSGIEALSARDLFYYAKALVDCNFTDSAINTFNKFINHPLAWWEDKATAYWQISIIHKNNKKYEAARNAAIWAIAVKHTYAEGYCLLGDICLEEQQYSAAAHWYSIAINVERGRQTFGETREAYYTWIPHLQLCFCYAQLGDIANARLHNRKVLEFQPNNPNALYNLTIIDKKRNGNGKKLNLGSGGKKEVGYVSCDLFQAPGVEEVFSLDDVPYADGTIAGIYSEHAIEHLPRHQSKDAFKEWARVLKPGGELILKCPDLELCCKGYIEHPDLRWWFDWTLFGRQETNGLPDLGQFHYCGYDKEQLRLMLEQSGFVIDYMENYDGWDTPSIACRAVRKVSDIRLGWYTDIDWDNASVRLRMLNIDRWLRAAGYNSKIVATSDLKNRINDFDILVVGKHWTKEYLDSVDLYRASGGKIILDMNEDYFAPLADELDRALDSADLIVCCSKKLADKVICSGRTAVVVIEDGFETVPDLNCKYEDKGRLKAGWIGYGGNAELAERFRPMLDELGYDLITIHEHDNATYKWGRDNWFNVLLDCDIAIAPQRVEKQPCKSNNKLTAYQALGLPVVASPLPAYLDIAEHGQNILLATEDSEWFAAFAELKDTHRRQEIGANGKALAMRFSTDAIRDKWTDVLFSIISKDQDAVVDIIIPTYNCPEYLEACLTSIKDVTSECFYGITVVDVGKTKNIDHEIMKKRMLGGFCKFYNLIIPETKTNFSMSNNIALRQTHAPYVCFLNDDTIVTTNWLMELKNGIDVDGFDIIGPFSNCDKGWLHNEDIIINGIDLHPAMSLSDIGDIVGAPIYNYGAVRSKSTVASIERPWLAFYCTLIKRSLINEVGFLNEECVNTCEDTDYCGRAQKFGFRCLEKMTSFVFHFGGKARGVSEKEDYIKHHEEDSANYVRLNNQYGKKCVIIYSGPSYEPWAPSSIDNGGIGGSETAVIHMASELTKLGCFVTVFNDCRHLAGKYGDVEYRPYECFADYADMNYFDVFISSRDIGVFALPIRAAKKICWVHDIWLSPNNILPDYESKVDKFLCLSKWHKDFFSQHHNIDPNRIFVTRNGIDLSKFSDAAVHPRDRFRFIYSSSPDRGLDVLLDMWPEILRLEPRANLKVFYGFDNWNKSIEKSQNPDQIILRDNILKGLNQANISVCGRVDQRTLAEEMKSASIWAYPTHFWETFCITALEAQAAGLGVVASGLCGLLDSVICGETVHVPDYWQSWHINHSNEYKAAFMSRVEKLLKNEETLLELKQTAITASKAFSWSDVASMWMDKIL